MADESVFCVFKQKNQKIKILKKIYDKKIIKNIL